MAGEKPHGAIIKQKIFVESHTGLVLRVKSSKVKQQRFNRGDMVKMWRCSFNQVVCVVTIIGHEESTEVVNWSKSQLVW